MLKCASQASINSGVGNRPELVWQKLARHYHSGLEVYQHSPQPSCTVQIVGEVPTSVRRGSWKVGRPRSQDPGTRPRYCKARPIPYAMRSKVDAELVRLKKEGIIQPVQFAATIVPVIKADKSWVVPVQPTPIWCVVRSWYFPEDNGVDPEWSTQCRGVHQQYPGDRTNRRSTPSNRGGRLQAAGLRLKREKCVFMVPSVGYLGHRIDAQGLHPLLEKVKAVQDAPKPRNITELKSYLGLLSYYSKFLPNLSTVLAPLYTLLRNEEPWKWKAAQDKSFQQSKEFLKYWFILTRVLTYTWHAMHRHRSCSLSPNARRHREASWFCIPDSE